MSHPSTSPDSGEVYTAPRKTMWLWGVGTIADAILICSFALVFPIFNTGFGLPAEWLSWALMVPRLLDGLLGPFIGYWSDNTHTRWGRRKPFLLVSGLSGALVFAGLWWASPEWSKPAQFGYVVLFGTLYYTTWGIYSMTHNALGYELTDDYHERSRVMAIRNIFLQVITLGVGWIYPFALQPFFGGEVNGIRIISGVLAVIIIIAVLFPIFACKERFTVAKQKPTPIFQALKEALRIPSFRIYLAMRFFAMFGLVVFNQLIFYINVYYVFGGADQKKSATTLIAIATAITVGMTLVALPWVPKLSKKIGKRKGVIIGASVAVFQACLVPFLYTPDSALFRGLAEWFPGLGIDSKVLSPYLQLLAAFLLMPLVTVAVVLRDAIVPDICDVDELENGKRREGLFTAVVNFVYKMEVSLCVVLVGYMLKLSGFNQKAAVQSAEVLANLKWCAYLPNILFAVLALILAIKFPITEAFMAGVHEKLGQRRTFMK
jgi:GPH family glycoside/pentoside/hexuronide:cation symporter